jgi:hypothetical protein
VAVDLPRFGQADRARARAAADVLRQPLALPPGEALGVVHPVGGETGVEDDSTRDHRTAERASAHLIDPGDAREPRRPRLLFEAPRAAELLSLVDERPTSAPPRLLVRHAPPSE